MLGSLLGLWLSRRPKLSVEFIAAGGLCIGAGIAGLHYIDMAAMRMPARISYNPILVAASIVVAIFFGFLSLLIGRRYQRDDTRRSFINQGAAAAVMAVAIFGQHYTAMAAASFYATPREPDWRNGNLPAEDLPQAVLFATLLILAIAFVGVSIDRRRSLRDWTSRRLVAAQERERRRISRVLHEDVGQLLTVLRLNLQRLESTVLARAVLAESIALVDETLARVRALSVELRPSVLDDLGLAEAVAWYANRQAEWAGYSVVVEQSLGEHRLPEAVETAAFRIVQQALTNVARHAHARNVHITLRKLPRSVELTVADDGIGFDVRDARARSRAGESLGLIDMNEQATLAGGSLSVESSARDGSVIRVRFPMNSGE
jgi:signal transduction histidine kinase